LHAQGKDPVYQCAWSTAHHAIAVASPRRMGAAVIHKFDPKQAPALASKPKDKKDPHEAAGLDVQRVEHRQRMQVPDVLTPAVVAEMLVSLRQSKQHLLYKVVMMMMIISPFGQVGPWAPSSGARDVFTSIAYVKRMFPHNVPNGGRGGRGGATWGVELWVV
jgi:hypothetical protein